MEIAPDLSWITITAPDNFHAHFRQEKLMEFLVPFFIRYGWRGRIVAEPNTQPAILTGEQAIEYGEAITKLARAVKGGDTLEIIVTIQITEETTQHMVRDAYARGVRVAKVYPRYVTTHSNNGVVDYTKIYPALAVAEELGMVVQFHAEHPSFDIIGRWKEPKFRKILDPIIKLFPKLKLTVEHVSSRSMVMWVGDQSPYVGAGIAVQYLYMTEDDLKGYSLRSGGLICVHDAGFKPCAKDPRDRAAVCAAAVSGNPKFWCANDDSGHLRSKKEAFRDACGSWNTIASLSLIFSFFERNKALNRLEPFLCHHGADFYGLPRNTHTIKMARKNWKVEMIYPILALNDSIVPFFAGEPMEWEVVE
jgi:dihydroorotase